jgi:hypothetical protein
MKHFRFSNRGLMATIVLLGVAFAGLRFPTPLWANVPDFPPKNPWHRVGYVTLISPGLYLRIGHSFFVC